jgi:AcrR family transcriptional regulator
MSVIYNSSESRSERRKRRTREQIRLATSELLLETGYSALTVQKITERADIGYGTFYLHYTDIDDAVWEVAREIMAMENERLIQAIQEIAPPRREYFGWCWLFAYLQEHREQYLELFGSNGSAELRKRYQAYMTGVYEHGMRERIYSASIDLPLEFMTQFMAGATIQLMLWWLETPNPYNPEQMAAMLYQMVFRAPPPLEDAR